MTGGNWKAKQSNDVLKAVFNKKYGVRKEVYQEFIETEKMPEIAEKVEIMINKKAETAFIVGLDNE